MGRRRTGAMPFSLFAFQDIITSVTGIMILVTLMLVLDFLEKVEGAPQQQSHQVIDEVRSALSKVAMEVATLQANFDQHDDVPNDLVVLDVSTLSSRLSSVLDVNTTLQMELQQVRTLQARTSESLATWRQRSEESSSTLNEIERLREKVESNQHKIDRLKMSNRVIFTVPQTGSEKPWLVEIGEGQIRVAEMGRSSPPQSFQTDDAFFSWLSARNPQNEYLVVLVSPESVDRFDVLANSLFEKRFPYGVNLLRSGQSAIDSETGAAP
jgi:hypothetical protein